MAVVVDAGDHLLLRHATAVSPILTVQAPGPALGRLCRLPVEVASTTVVHLLIRLDPDPDLDPDHGLLPFVVVADVDAAIITMMTDEEACLQMIAAAEAAVAAGDRVAAGRIKWPS